MKRLSLIGRGKERRISSFFQEKGRTEDEKEGKGSSEESTLSKKRESFKNRMLRKASVSSLGDSTKNLLANLGGGGNRKRKKSDSFHEEPPKKRVSGNEFTKLHDKSSVDTPEPSSSILIQPSPSKGSTRKRILALESSDIETKITTDIGEIIRLRGSWRNNTLLEEGDDINVLDPLEDANDGSFLIDDLNGLLVVHPDHLISGTSVVSSLFCMRKAVLSERYKGLEGTSKTMFIGTFLHALLQEGLKKNVQSITEINEVLDSLLKNSSIILDMATLGMTTKDVVQEVNPFLPHILFFVEKYVLGKTVNPPEQAFAPISRRAPPLPPSRWPGSITKVKDIEENIWSPRLGLKGKVDLTLEVNLHRPDPQGRTKKVLPLELKTGRPSGSAEHKGQVIMYSMIMSERRDDPKSGLLLYLRNSSVLEVNAGIHEMRGLVQLRNQLVSHLFNLDHMQLPEHINLKTACEKCPHLIACAASSGDRKFEESHAMSQLIPYSLKHLDEKELEFFHLWNKMVALETQEIRKKSRQKELWLKSPEERRKSNRALIDLTLIRQNELKHSFRGDMGEPKDPPFDIGETVLISTENAIALAQGTVYRLGSEVIEVILDRDIYNDDEWRNKVFYIDKYEYASSSAALVNLARLMVDSEEAKNLRRLIIHKQPVNFLSGLPKEVALNGKSILKPLNRVQQKAAFKTLMAEDNVLLKGMPGSGKTTLIVALVRLLAKTMNKSVLLTSYTNSAVDNILLKLASYGDVDFVRLGKKSRVNPKLYNNLFSPTTQIEEKLVVGTTCLGLNHPAVTSRRFDYCILDEAGQASLLPSIGPLFYAGKFVLVGDPKQLRPVVTSAEARSMGMNESIFSLLERENNVIPLTLQYRMNARITECANVMTYEGALECGSPEVASRVIATDYSTDTDPDWLKKVLDPSLDCSVVFVDTGSHGPELRHGRADIVNHYECDLIGRVLERIGEKGLEIGLVAPYRAQVSLLRQRFPKFDVNTVDQFQGRDKDVIFYSCTRSCEDVKEESRNSESILNDERRLNVAITRAKMKIIMLGSKDTLINFCPFKKLLNDFLKEEYIVCSQ